MRVEGRSTSTWPAAGKPVSRQWPLERTRAGSVGWESGMRMTDPEQLLSATVPAKSTALTAGAGAGAAAVAGAGRLVAAAVAGAAAAPRRRSDSNAPTRGFFMGVPSVTEVLSV
ncbi:hypothetical protein GCM10009612_12180 [Streptomyces beijiangensis]